MMEWALVILFGVAAVLLILSYALTKKAKKAEQRELELYSISFMEEINKLQQQIRNLELDNEILKNQVGIDTTDTEQHELLRDVLDLYKIGYSVSSIATEKNISEIEVQGMLSPFTKQKEGRQAANDR
jgi:low affinity Fe/Cu permease